MMHPPSHILSTSCSVLLVVAFAGTASNAQTLSGELRRDLLLPPPIDVPSDPHGQREGDRSVVVAAGLSALVPGAGQIYVGTPWWRPALYGAIEIAGWIGYGVWTSKGNQATSDFEAFADAHWDVTRYIAWIQQNYSGWSEEEVDHLAAEEALSRVIISTDQNLPPWERVDFDALNKLEKAVKGGFSHTLPRHGEQQYYEEIGKYIQYRSGWDDHVGGADSMIFDPSHVTERNLDYTRQRERANNLLSYADYAIAAIVVNHLISMLDAGLSARNMNISAAPVIDHDLFGGMSVGMQIRLEWGVW